MFAYHAFSTTDFDHWVDHGSILTGRDVNWNAGQALWDGDAGIPANGRFYAYAPFRLNSSAEANYGRYDIGVSTSDSSLKKSIVSQSLNVVSLRRPPGRNRARCCAPAQQVLANA